MEFYCAVDFDEPDIQKHVFEDFESMIERMKEEYYSHLEKEKATRKIESAYESDRQILDMFAGSIEGVENINDLGNVYPDYREAYNG